MGAEVEHRGYVIGYSENEDVWRCWDIDFSSAKLSAVRQKIDALERGHRKFSRPAIFVGYSDAPKPCVIVSLDEDRDRCWTTTDRQLTDRYGRAVDGKLRRQKVSLSQIIDDTPENQALVAQLGALRRAAAEAQQAASAHNNAIPRLTRDILIQRGAEAEPKA